MSVKTKRRLEKGRSSGLKGHPRAAAAPETPPAKPMSPAQLWSIIAGVPFLALLIAYWPAIHGEFVFDDIHMRFASVHPERQPLRQWLIGSRPLTGLSYWLNYQIGGADTFVYHFTSLLLHYIAAWMVFFVVRKILQLAAIPARRALITAGFCAGIFLLHPLQTEAVAYISSRSENLSVAFAFAAWAVFLYRRSTSINFPMVGLVLLLCGAAVMGKEHVAVLPAVLLLTDYYWNPGFSFQGIWRNWRLYGILAVLGSVTGILLYQYLAHEPTVGFHMKEFTWYQYLFTQCRVFFLYLWLLLFPAGQNADYDIAVSHTPFEQGAIFAMAALGVAIVAAFLWRKRYPIASFGFFVALILFAPTSSIVPIRDLAAERRVYLPLIGLLLIAAEVVVRLRWSERVLTCALAGILLLSGVCTWNRSQVWASSLALWSDTAAKSPQKARPHLGLAAADFSAHRSAEAAVQYELANRLDPHYDANFYANWAAALEGAGRHQEAIETGRKAVEMSPNAATYDALGRIVALNGDIPQALELLEKGVKIDPSYLPIYIDRADILMALDRNAEACASFLKARSLDPQNPSAAKGLADLHCPGAF